MLQSLLENQWHYIQSTHFYTSSRILTESICKLNIIKPTITNNQIKNNVATLSQFLLQCYQKNQNMRSILLEWLNICIFNVSAMNEEYFDELENQMLQSTEDVQSKLTKNKKMSEFDRHGLNILRNGMKLWLEELFKSEFISKLIKDANEKMVQKWQELRSIFETIDYLIVKNNISSTVEIKKIVKLLQDHSNNQSNLFEEKINALNVVVFSQGQGFIAFLQSINNNYTANLQELAKIINANYYNLTPPRHIFSSTKISGRRFLEQLCDQLIRNVQKTEIFGQKMETFRSYELFAEIITQKWSGLFIEFTNQIIIKMMKHALVYSESVLQIMESFWLFLKHKMVFEYPTFQYFCYYLNEGLIHKYNKADALEIMKKFIFNRFLMNPNYYLQFYAPTEQQLYLYVQAVNLLRVMFYDKKVKAIQGNPSNQQIHNISISLNTSLIEFLSENKSKIAKGADSKDRGIYLNDKIVRKFYVRMSDDLKLNKQVMKKQQLQMNHDISLSFSLKNESMFKSHLPNSSVIQANDSKRSASKDKDHSLRVMIDDLKEFKTQTEIPLKSSDYLPPKSHQTQRPLTKKTQETTINMTNGIASERQMLDDLIFLRREYGDQRRAIQERLAQKKQNREATIRNLTLISDELASYRKQIQKDVNLVQIHLHLS